MQRNCRLAKKGPFEWTLQYGYGNFEKGAVVEGQKGHSLLLNDASNQKYKVLPI